jgi:hypothetical protein
MLDHAKGMDVDPETVAALETAMESRVAAKPVADHDAKAVSAVVALHKADDHAGVADACTTLFATEGTTTATMDRVRPLFLRSLMQTDRHTDAIDHLYTVVSEQDDPDQRWINLLVQVSASRADAQMIDKIMALGDKLGADTNTSALERRRDVLTRQVANG